MGSVFEQFLNNFQITKITGFMKWDPTGGVPWINLMTLKYKIQFVEDQLFLELILSSAYSFLRTKLSSY
jgi:hypothetical protein